MTTAQKFVKLDSGESVFFTRQLEHIKTKTYDVLYPEFQSRSLIPVSMEAGPGARTITYRQFDQVGVAKIISNYANDLPRVDVSAKEFTANVRSLGDAYGYSVQDIRSAQMAGVPLEQRKANAAKRAILQTEDDIAFNGDSSHGLGGLFSNANVTDVAIPADGTGSSALWTAKTADLILRDMNLLVDTVLDLTKGVEQPDTMIMPLAQYNLISNKQMPNVNSTVKKFFLENNSYIKNIQVCFKCKGAGVGGTDLFMVYKKDPDKLSLEIPQDFEQFPVQEEGLEFVVNCHSRVGGVIIYYPLSIAKGDGI